MGDGCGSGTGLDPDSIFYCGSLGTKAVLSLTLVYIIFYVSSPNPFRIPDPGVKKAPDPGSGSATLVDSDCFFLLHKSRYHSGS
jgi:hypothetical protein